MDLQIKFIRKNRNLKQQDVASYLKMSLSNYNKKENGKVKFSLEEAKKMSRLFQTDIDNFF